MTIRVIVHGEAVPQGSTRAFINRRTGRPVVTSDNPRTRPWRDTVATAARFAMGAHGMLTGAVGLIIEIRVKRPAGHYGKRGTLLPSARRHPTTKPDIDKVARAILDALTDVAYRDDAQVVHLRVFQSYEDDLRIPPRTEVTIVDLDDQWAAA